MPRRNLAAARSTPQYLQALALPRRVADGVLEDEPGGGCPALPREAAALAAGTPQVVLPLAWDQPDNARRLQGLGVGIRLGPRQRTAGHLARALSRLRSPGVRARCRAVADRVGKVDGLAVAAQWVEGLVTPAPVRPRGPTAV